MSVCPECGATTQASTCSRDGCPTLDPAVLEAPDRGDIGSLIGEKYRVLNIVGRGGMGVVYRAWQRDMRRLVALKVANAQSMDEAGTRRFLREVRVVAGLAHPNTVRVFDYGQLPDGRLFFTMEFLEGQSLSRLLRRREPFDDRRILRVGTQVLKSLGEAHAAGIVHRDLSPDNIFLCRLFGEADFVKVLDFGVAKGMAFEAGEEKLTVAGVFVGKPAYASPEQVEGSVELDGRSDLYSLGIVLYQMCAGQVPFQSTTPMKVLIAHLREPPRDVQEVATRPIHPDLASLVMRLLAKKREDRPQNAAEALEEMLRIEEQFVRTPSPDTAGIRVPVVTTGTSLVRRKRRRMRNWAIGIGVALLLGGVGAAALVSVASRQDLSPRQDLSSGGQVAEPARPPQANEAEAEVRKTDGPGTSPEGASPGVQAKQADSPAGSPDPGEASRPKAPAAGTATASPPPADGPSRVREPASGSRKTGPSKRAPEKGQAPTRAKDAPKGPGGWTF